MQVDYIIVGQGVAGTLLSWSLINAGCKVLVIDENKHHTSSKVASGLINPVTGKRVVRSWMIEELMPVAIDAYKMLEQELGCDLITQCNLLDFFPTLEARDIYHHAMQKDSAYLQLANASDLEQYFRSNYGIGEITPCWLIDLNSLIENWREVLLQRDMLLNEKFNWNDCKVSADGIVYKNVSAKRIICCAGTGGFDNPYFSLLPYTKNKGEVIIASIAGLPRNKIYKQGALKIVPWKDDQFWIGSSFAWKYKDIEPTEAFRKRVEEHLPYWLKLPVSIVDHWAAERPTTVGQLPFVGFHPSMPSVGVLNGMGTKGCSLAPYFSKQLTEHLVNDAPILPDADVKRFTRILTRHKVSSSNN